MAIGRQPQGYARLYKLSLYFLWALLALMCSAFGTLTHRAYKRYCNFADRALALKKEVEVAEQRLLYKETYVHKLEHDATFLEKTLRERLGYSAPNELIFRFDERTPSL